MKSIRRTGAVCAWLALTLAPAAQAVELTSRYTNLGPGAAGATAWRVDLTLRNDDASLVSAANPSGAITEFTVFFPFASAGALAARATPAGWDALIVAPDSSPSDGYADYLAAVPLPVGGVAGSFAVGFDWSGPGAPGALRYTVVDPDRYVTLYEGATVPSVVSPVPEPATASLTLLGLGLGLIGLAAGTRRARVVGARVRSASGSRA